VTVRALLACVLAIGALVVLSGTKPARQDRPNVVQVQTKATPLYREPSNKQRKTSALGLLGGTAATNKLLWPYESHKNAIISGGVLLLVLWIASEVLLK